MSASRVACAGLAVMIAVAGTMVVPGLSHVARSSEIAHRVSPKGDRVASVRAKPVSSVAAFLASGGRDDFAVTLRDRHGAVVYASDRRRQVTRVAKDTHIAAIPVPGGSAAPGEPAADAMPAAAPSRPAPAVRRVPVGCDRLVSALVRSAAADIPGRCTT